MISVPTFMIGIDPVWGGGNSFADCHFLLPGNWGGGGVKFLAFVSGGGG